MWVGERFVDVASSKVNSPKFVDVLENCPMRGIAEVSARDLVEKVPR
jgi:hypothetical protein